MRTKRETQPRLPTEDDEQKHLLEWAERQACAYPALRWLFHIPNGGSRHLLEAVKLKAMGVKPGVPDLMLPVPRARYHGLYIEMKRSRGGTVNEAQAAWIAFLRSQGYAVLVCEGWAEAQRALLWYVRLGAFGKEERVRTRHS